MKNVSLFSLSCFCAAELFAAASAVPRVDESAVSMEQASDRLVTVSYKLTDAPGIVTIDFQTNSTVGWVSIGAENFQNVGGDVNCIVTELDTTKTITWRPEVSWEGHVVTNGLRAVVKAWALDNPPPYMAINLGVDDFIAFYPDAGAVPGGITDDIYKTEWLLMRRIPAANVVWRMGSPLGEIGKNYDDTNNFRETPHLVRLSSDYYMGVYEVTEYQYLRAMNKSLSEIGADKYLMPKNNIKWDDIRGYGSTGKDYEWPKNKPAVSPTSFMGFMRNRWSAAGNFDLPTEAQWEYAARGGQSGGTKYSGSNTIDDVAWYRDNSNNKTHPVGTKSPNALGLYDMSGNLWEWCLDWYGDYPSQAQTNPQGPTSGYDRVGRGGCWVLNAEYCRVSDHDGSNPSLRGNSLGFRVVLL